MNRSTTGVGVLVLVATLGACAFADLRMAPDDPAAPAPATPAPESPEAPEAEPVPEAEPDPATASSVLDGVLPCGVRLIVAQDKTLPVAAVVLAIETGTEDDPPDQPGLVHALAYHLWQGNRELAPGAALAIAHDAGGAAGFAIGPAQIRFESLVPMSHVDEAISVEAQRLRAPTVTPILWSDTLSRAGDDRGRSWVLPVSIVAAVHGVAGLDHAGHVVPSELAELAPRAVGNAMADRFDYAIATLVVVGPEAPGEIWARGVQAFADLPPAARHVPDRTIDRTPGSAPRRVSLQGSAGDLLAWPIDGEPGARAQALVWCQALDRMRRVDGEPPRARTRCRMDDDPRRAMVIVRATGTGDPVALVRARLQRLAAEDNESTVARVRGDLRAQWSHQLRTPLPLARRLAESAPAPAGAPVQERALDELTGLHELTREGPAVVPEIGTATWIVGPGGAATPGEAGEVPR